MGGGLIALGGTKLRQKREEKEGEVALGGLGGIWTTANSNHHRFSRERPRMVETLDVIKFICKDIWMIVFRKQIDNLKTNHRVRCLPP